jgi:hypothetical protein
MGIIEPDDAGDDEAPVNIFAYTFKNDLLKSPRLIDLFVAQHGNHGITSNQQKNRNVEKPLRI